MKNLIKAMLVMVFALVLSLTLTITASCEEGNANETPGTNEGGDPTNTDGPSENPETPETPETPIVPPEVKATALTITGSFDNTKEQDTSKYIQIAPFGTYQLQTVVTPTDATSKVAYKVQDGYG